MNISDIRKNYMLHQLNEEDAGNDPVQFFIKWLGEAINAEAGEPTAMVLSTVDKHCRPSSRIVLLKGCEEGEFRFFTNYESSKGRQLAENPNASLVFFWKELERQVRVEGSVKKLPAELSDAYYNSRPLESRIGAWISPQSSVIDSREYLEKLYVLKRTEIETGMELLRPAHWGGYALIPTMIEFWQGRASRLHDRIRFRLVKENWVKERLAP